uniref:CRAL-TRIO domain-containing protein n=1 Tax=Grammatophora oceanica TaxID=210454 RepID=A0A7S1VHQ1_9STRA|mmetsp:Transcript_46866/g.69693  ORF Transcript_46866/g.69693 Transcript_46866/m.69693 type:complete len:422 (+) Transcript_46866:78-1343(+)
MSSSGWSLFVASPPVHQVHPDVAESICEALAFENRHETMVFMNSDPKKIFPSPNSKDADIFFDAVAYDLDEADDPFGIDVGSAPLSTRGGSSAAFSPSLRNRVRTLSSSSFVSAVSHGGAVPPATPSTQEIQEERQEKNEQASPSSPSGQIERNVYVPKAPPTELPYRFLMAGKGDPVEGQRRYEETLEWRKEHRVDYILKDAHPDYDTIREHYPLYCHLRGRNNEPVFYEKPPKTNLKALRKAGVGLDKMLRHYCMITEFGWQYIEPGDDAKSVYIIDLEGIRMTDFVGETVDFVKKGSAFTGAHYPERAGYVFVINVPSWFKMIWNVVKPMVDPVTLEKIYILRGKNEIREYMTERIPLENIPPEYGGTSVPLGESPEEIALNNLMKHNNAVADGTCQCAGHQGDPPCPFCEFVPARSY